MAVVKTTGSTPVTGYKNTTPLSGVDPDIWEKAIDTYVKSAGVQAAEQQKNAAQAAVSGYTRNPALTQAQNNIVNRPKFDYDYSKDPLYQQYKDSYTRQGRLAMTDTMAQAAALTGGYGNSYAQSAGQQTFNGYMQQLNDKLPELEQRAFDRYTAEGDDLYRLYSMLYGEERDTLGDLRSDRDYYTGEYWNAANDDYSKFSADRSNALNIAGLQNGEYWNDKNFNYNAEQDKAQLELAYAQLAEQQKQNSISNNQWERNYALSLAGSGGDSGDVNLFTYAGEDPSNNGNNVYYDSNGKKYSVAVGVNPYTGTKNSDAKNGTFSNGYQPNNIGGEKLKKYSKDGVPQVVNVNGREQNVWTVNEKLYYWDGTKNKYMEITD